MKQVIILSDEKRPPNEKMVTALMYNSELNEVRRLHNLIMQAGFDALATILANFDTLWLSAAQVNKRLWLAREDDDNPSLYADVVVAGLEAAKPAEATLGQVNTAMEDVILASARAGSWQKLVNLASSASAAQRDRLYLIIAFLVLRDLLDSAK